MVEALSSNFLGVNSNRSFNIAYTNQMLLQRQTVETLI